ncbi:hypothetical protein [Streptomyces africanus]|uniref:hypothetical protein n=1 Tax=Streptomyces africanus TaxID=231024 RepID=UPI0035211892
MSKGTIVHHYGTKDRLLAALHESYMRRRLAEAYLITNRLSSQSEQLAGCSSPSCCTRSTTATPRSPSNGRSPGSRTMRP